LQAHLTRRTVHSPSLQAAAHTRVAARRASFVAATPVAKLRAAAPRPASTVGRAVRVSAQFCDDADLDAAGFGQHVFKGDVASKYLSKYGESASLLETPAWTATKADTVASALLDWARDNGASVYTHWFCPMGSSGACLRWSWRRRRCAGREIGVHLLERGPITLWHTPTDPRFAPPRPQASARATPAAWAT